MSMVVRTNTMAMNANSALNKNNSTVAGNLQKLSTGFRINRAADDASGLAVSEKMKAQIKALDQAGKNAQDGASLIKTAEGYMGEIHDMLNRIVELAEKSANGTYETKSLAEGGSAAETYKNAETDRQAIQDEVDQLTTEIDRIAKTANFNQLKLLDGTLDASEGTAVTTYTYETAAKPVATTTYAVSDLDTELVHGSEDGKVNASNFNELVAAGLFTKDGDTVTKLDSNATYNAEGHYFKLAAGKTGTTSYADDAFEDLYADAEGQTKLTAANIGDVTGNTVYKKTPHEGTEGGGAGTALKLQIGETSEAADKLEVSIKSFKTADLFSEIAGEKANKNEDGTGGISIVVNNESAAAKTAGFYKEDPTAAEGYQGLTLNVSNQDAAALVAEKVRDVINSVSAQRATLGAMENRLDYTMNNLDTASQNITDANSRIRDTDMAKTMMQYTQGNTLTQAAQAMLAQANQAPSQVLQLLQ